MHAHYKPWTLITTVINFMSEIICHLKFRMLSKYIVEIVRKLIIRDFYYKIYVNLVIVIQEIDW